jgi:hypothetical protein
MLCGEFKTVFIRVNPRFRPESIAEFNLNRTKQAYPEQRRMDQISESRRLRKKNGKKGERTSRCTVALLAINYFCTKHTLLFFQRTQTIKMFDSRAEIAF